MAIDLKGASPGGKNHKHVGRNSPIWVQAPESASNVRLPEQPRVTVTAYYVSRLKRGLDDGSHQMKV